MAASNRNVKRVALLVMAMLTCVLAAACSSGRSSTPTSKATPRYTVPKGATVDVSRLFDTQWALVAVKDGRGRSVVFVRPDGPSPGQVSFPYRGSGLSTYLSTTTGPPPPPRFIWDVCTTGTGRLRASDGTIDTSAIVVNHGQCWNRYPYMANRIPAQYAFARVLESRSHRVAWFIDDDGQLHLVSPTTGESLIFQQSTHG